MAVIEKIEGDAVTFWPDIPFIRGACDWCYLHRFGCRGIDTVAGTGEIDLGNRNVRTALEQNGATDCGILPVLREQGAE